MGKETLIFGSSVATFHDVNWRLKLVFLILIFFLKSNSFAVFLLTQISLNHCPERADLCRKDKNYVPMSIKPTACTSKISLMERKNTFTLMCSCNCTIHYLIWTLNFTLNMGIQSLSSWCRLIAASQWSDTIMDSAYMTWSKSTVCLNAN